MKVWTNVYSIKSFNSSQNDKENKINSFFQIKNELLAIQVKLLDLSLIHIYFYCYNLAKDDLTYILATDADVKFEPSDVMALMDLMSRNPKVGAVCGRTHPMGAGPMVWYQIFDYAIGHWLLKV